MDIPQKILLTRKSKGYTQESLANATNLSLSTIQRIENGKVIPRAHTLKILSDVLEIELFSDPMDNKNIKIGTEDWSIFLQISFIFVFVPPLNILCLLKVWDNKKQQDRSELVVDKILKFQIRSFIILLLSLMLIPVFSYFLTGQKTYGQINLPLFLYIFFVIINILVPSIFYRQSIFKELQTS